MGLPSRGRYQSFGASVRFEKYFHASTNTHIIRQLDGTEFGPFPIKGYGDFADEAFRAYVGELSEGVSRLPIERLAEIERLLAKFPPAATRKLELQMILPEQIKLKLAAQAKEQNVSIGLYVQRVLISNIPLNTGKQRFRVWYSDVQKRSKENARLLRDTKSTTLAFPVDVIDVSRLQASLPRQSIAALLHDVLLAGPIDSDAVFEGARIAHQARSAVVAH